MRREDLNLERIHNYIQKLFIDAGHPEIRDKTLIVEMEELSHLNKFTIKLNIANETIDVKSFYSWDQTLIFFLRDLAKSANTLAAYMHLGTLLDPDSWIDLYFLDEYFGTKSRPDDILDVWRYVAQLSLPLESHSDYAEYLPTYQCQPRFDLEEKVREKIKAAQFYEAFLDEPFKPWQIDCLNKFHTNEKENKPMKPTMTKEDIEFKAAMDAVAKERQEKIDAANKAAAVQAAELEEQNRLDEIKADMKDLAFKRRAYFQALLDEGFNEDQAMKILLNEF